MYSKHSRSSKKKTCTKNNIDLFTDNLKLLEKNKKYIETIDKTFIKQYKTYATSDEKINLYSFVDEIPYKMKFIEKLGLIRESVHLGQKKLFLTQIWFLTEYLAKYNDNAIVVYAGAAPTNTMNFLCKLFPNVKFLLIDPNPFIIYDCENNMKTLEFVKIKNYKPRNNEKLGRSAIIEIEKMDKKAMDMFKTIKEQIFVYHDIYIDEHSDLIRNELGDVFFWSDIRTGDGNSLPADNHILWNSAQQYIWIRKLQPKIAMLKFKIPFYFEEKEKYINSIKNTTIPQQIIDINNAKEMGLKIIANYKNDKFKFLKGRTLVQCWPGVTSTETRLILTQNTIIKNKLQNYTRDDYEAPLNYHNLISRQYTIFPNKFYDPAHGKDYCYDCARETQILTDYEKKYNIMSAGKIREILDVILPRNECHGHYKKIIMY